jgi:DNA-binding CsgD family transcriptional regulator
MINRIRDIRRQKGLTLADVAVRCAPPTTAQTIGRLETGMRSLSLGWMNRIAAALDVDPQLLVKAEVDSEPQIIARLGASGAEALAKPMSAVLPVGTGSAQLVVMSVDTSAGEYRAGDQVWLRQIGPEDFGRALNREAPHEAGIWSFEDLSAHRPVRAELTAREREVAALLMDGMTSKEIGKALAISHRTVEIYRAKLMRKYKASTTADLVHKLLVG